MRLEMKYYLFECPKKRHGIITDKSVVIDKQFKNCPKCKSEQFPLHPIKTIPIRPDTKKIKGIPIDEIKKSIKEKGFREWEDIAGKVTFGEEIVVNKS